MGYDLIYTKNFIKWYKSLSDKKLLSLLFARFNRVKFGYFGDAKYISDGVYELRFFHGAGYRVYYTIKDDSIVFLLAGGDKSTQKRDIKKAIQLAGDLDE